MKYCHYFLLLTFLLLGLGSEVQSQNSEFDISFQQNNDHSVDFNFQKQIYGSVFVSIKFDNLRNASQRAYKGCITGMSGRVFTLKPEDSKRGIGFSWSYRYQRGKPIGRLKKDFVYLLPFSNNTKVSVQNLGYVGKRFGHGAPDSWKAFQFRTDKEETVLAARKGLVVKVVDEFISDTTKNYYFKDGVNEVLIEHRDGTLARYSGFKGGSIKVKPGQRVYPQQELGMLARYDSDKGYQLHFCVYYLNTRDIDNLNTEEKKMNMHAYVNPLFYWKGGQSIILPRNDYVADCTDEIITKEFSRREKKKYLKGELK